MVFISAFIFALAARSVWANDEIACTGSAFDWYLKSIDEPPLSWHEKMGRDYGDDVVGPTRVRNPDDPCHDPSIPPSLKLLCFRCQGGERSEQGNLDKSLLIQPHTLKYRRRRHRSQIEDERLHARRYKQLGLLQRRDKGDGDDGGDDDDDDDGDGGSDSGSEEDHGGPKTPSPPAAPSPQPSPSGPPLQNPLQTAVPTTTILTTTLTKTQEISNTQSAATTQTSITPVQSSFPSKQVQGSSTSFTTASTAFSTNPTLSSSSIDAISSPALSSETLNSISSSTAPSSIELGNTSTLPGSSLSTAAAGEGEGPVPLTAAETFGIIFSALILTGSIGLLIWVIFRKRRSSSGSSSRGPLTSIFISSRSRLHDEESVIAPPTIHSIPTLTSIDWESSTGSDNDSIIYKSSPTKEKFP